MIVWLFRFPHILMLDGSLYRNVVLQINFSFVWLCNHSTLLSNDSSTYPRPKRTWPSEIRPYVIRKFYLSFPCLLLRAYQPIASLSKALWNPNFWKQEIGGAGWDLSLFFQLDVGVWPKKSTKQFFQFPLLRLNANYDASSTRCARRLQESLGCYRGRW